MQQKRTLRHIAFHHRHFLWHFLAVPLWIGVGYSLALWHAQVQAEPLQTQVEERTTHEAILSAQSEAGAEEVRDTQEFILEEATPIPSATVEVIEPSPTAVATPLSSPTPNQTTSISPRASPTVTSTASPSATPAASVTPTLEPTVEPTLEPTIEPSPSSTPSTSPSLEPSESPSVEPSVSPVPSPSANNNSDNGNGNSNGKDKNKPGKVLGATTEYEWELVVLKLLLLLFW